MSSSTPGQTSTPSSDFKSILDAGLSRALSEYKNKTGKPLLDHPLAAELKRCDSVDAIKAIFQVQAEAFQQFRDGDKRLMKWINPVVDVLSAFSAIGGVSGHVRPLNCRSCNIEAHPNIICRGFPLRKPSLARSEFFSLSVSSPSLIVDPSYHPHFIGSKRRESESRCARRTT